MKQIKNLLLFAIFVLLAGCAGSSSNDSVVIQGKFTFPAAMEWVRLQHLNQEKTQIAEIIPDPDGTFRIEFNTPSTDFYQLVFSNGDFLNLILQPGEEAVITMDGFPLRSNMQVQGSVYTTHFIAVGDMLRIVELRQDSLRKAYDALQTPEAKALRNDEFRMFSERMVEEKRSIIRDFATKNPGSPACLFYLNQLDLADDLPLFEKVNAALLEKFPENIYVIELNYTVTAEAKLKPGMPAPDFALPDPDGKLIHVSDFRGSYLLLDFWASWCEPCRRENPNVMAMYNEYRDYGFQILGVSLDNDRQKWIEAIRADGMTWPQVSDLQKWNSFGAQTYAVRAIPHTVLIDPEGNIVAVKLRGNELRYKLKELLR
ncbi:MAG: TlpA disulfide reductase family protein [Bacteroidales bacterium]|nr:TlpA family protein disulfide reductase [Bacteroidales bacterium]MDD2322546.1 TlpA disulfide reductase family protein [Bacteroidales bacterium]MDD3009820.1 TlpA disulfide reductase family protein [Bacteroidales bacterium]MDD3961369.1 TlpA disulfide reductase family protein [Bacteroidales bacterium]MDY0285210.1 TlpA disulfide reductase family protein [Bacteroidales bacterium]